MEPQVEAMLGKLDAGHKATIEKQTSTLAKLQSLHEITHKAFSETNAKVLKLESKRCWAAVRRFWKREI